LLEGFAVVSSCSVSGSRPFVGASEDGRLVGAVLDRIMGPSAVPKTGRMLGLSGVNATGAKVDSDDGSFSVRFLIGLRDLSPKLPTKKTCTTAAEATIATAAIATLVATDMQGFPAAAMAIVPAAVAADAPVNTDASIAID
jgi:hypothetical protein